MYLGLYILGGLIGLLMLLGVLGPVLFPRRFRPMKRVNDRTVRKLRRRVSEIKKLGLFVQGPARELASTAGVLIGKASAALDWDRPEEGLPYANLASAALYWVETLLTGLYLEERPHDRDRDGELWTTDRVEMGITALLNGQLEDARLRFDVSDFHNLHPDLQRVITLAMDLRCKMVGWICSSRVTRDT